MELLELDSRSSYYRFLNSHILQFTVERTMLSKLSLNVATPQSFSPGLMQKFDFDAFKITVLQEKSSVQVL
jgi:hypothetical protein